MYQKQRDSISCPFADDGKGLAPAQLDETTKKTGILILTVTIFCRAAICRHSFPPRHLKIEHVVIFILLRVLSASFVPNTDSKSNS